MANEKISAMPDIVTLHGSDIVPLVRSGDTTNYSASMTEIATFVSSTSGGVVSFSGGSTGLTPSTATAGAISLAGVLLPGFGGTGASTLAANYLLRGNGTSPVTQSVIYNNGTNVGINNVSPNFFLDIPLGSVNPTVNIGSRTNNVTNTVLQVQNSLASYAVSDSAAASVVAADTNFYNSGTSSTFSGTILNYYGTASASTVLGSSAAKVGQVLFQNTVSGVISTNGPSPIIFGTTSTERMRIAATGNVGIGISAPIYTLDINGTARLSGNSGNLQFLINNTSSYYKSQIGFQNNGTPKWSVGVDIADAGNQNFYVYDDVAGQTRFYINPTGNVGIGTTSPGQNLSVVGTGSFSGVLTANGGTVISTATNMAANPVTGTPSVSTFLRGDGAWATPSGGGNVSNVGTPTSGQIAQWTGATTIQGVSTTGTNSVALRDSSANISANNFFLNYTNVAAAGTTTVLTASSSPSYVVTGSGGQTYQLPDATTLPIGAEFEFNNNQSSGSVVVKNNSGTTVLTVGSGGYGIVILLTNSVAAGTWDTHFFVPSNVAWTANTLDYAGSITSAMWNGTVIAPNRGGTGVANSTASTLTISGAYPLGLTLSASTSLTLPTSGTVTALGNTTTGSGSIVLASGPVLVTPTLGAATATSVNGLTISSTTGVLTVASGKTLTASNSLAFAGTDGSTLNVGTGGTLAALAFLSAAPAGTLTGSTLASGVTASSLTSVGTLGTLNVTGNVGIGTTTPSFKLSVVANTSGNDGLLVSNTSTGASAQAIIGVNAQGWAGLQLVQIQASGTALLYTGDNVPMLFSTNAVERMRITAAGNVGIGTSSPGTGTILDVQSTTAGVRFPNMTTTQKNAITPAAGTVVFDTTLAKLCVYSGSAWQTITSV